MVQSTISQPAAIGAREHIPVRECLVNGQRTSHDRASYRIVCALAPLDIQCALQECSQHKGGNDGNRAA